MNKEKLEKLATEKNDPCITISMNTNRTFPANQNDIIVLKNLLEEATERVIKEFGKRPVSDLLEKLAHIESEIDVNYNLDSLHIFLSNATQEIIRSAWPTASHSKAARGSLDRDGCRPERPRLAARPGTRPGPDWGRNPVPGLRHSGAFAAPRH